MIVDSKPCWMTGISILHLYIAIFYQFCYNSNFLIHLCSIFLERNHLDTCLESKRQLNQMIYFQIGKLSKLRTHNCPALSQHHRSIHLYQNLNTKRNTHSICIRNMHDLNIVIIIKHATWTIVIPKQQGYRKIHFKQFVWSNRQNSRNIFRNIRGTFLFWKPSKFRIYTNSNASKCESASSNCQRIILEFEQNFTQKI